MSAGLPISKNVGIEIRNAMTSMATSIQSVATNIDMNNQQLININNTLNNRVMKSLNHIAKIMTNLPGILSTLQSPLLLIAENTQAMRDAFTKIVGIGGSVNEFGQSSAIFKPIETLTEATDPLLNAMILLLEFTAQILGTLEIISENMSDAVFFLIGTEFELIKLNQKQKRLTLSSKKKEEEEESGAGIFATIFGVGGFFISFLEKMGVFQGIMDALSPTIEIVGGLIEALSAGITATLIPVLQPLNDALVNLMPLFQEVGIIIGGLIAEVLGAFIDILVQFMPIIEPLLEVFLSLLQVGLIPLKILLQLLSPIFDALLPHVETFSNFMGGLANFIIDVANAFIDFINKMDVFNWFPDLQRLEKIDLSGEEAKNEEQRKADADKALKEQQQQNEYLRIIAEEIGTSGRRFLL